MNIQISEKAKNQLLKRNSPLYVELELYFSCLIRKRVYFHEKPLTDGIPVPSAVNNLAIEFRPVMTRACLVGDADVHNPSVERFPIVKGERFFPKWFTLDFRKGQWRGEFGYGK